MKFAVAALALTVLTGGAARPAAAEPGFAMTLKPVIGADHQVSGIEVRQVLTGAETTDGTPLTFKVAIVYKRVDKVADRIIGLEVSDAEGEVPLATTDDEATKSGFPYYRRFRTTRPIKSPLTVTYTTLVRPPGGPNGPPYDLRPTGGGLAGGGGGFLLLPENLKSAQSKVHWNLVDLPSGSIAATTFGDGDFTLDGPPSNLVEGWYFAGPAEIRRDPPRNFSAYLLGDPPWDGPASLKWTSDAYAVMVKAYGYNPNPPPYRAFMRILDAPPYSSGTSTGPSFMLSRAKVGKTDPQPTHTIIFHEVAHSWTGAYGGPNGTWFSEGLNVHFTTTLPFHAGLTSVDEYLYDINFIARGYATNKARSWSAARIQPLGFADERARGLPYMRGALYFAQLDKQIQFHAGGRRTLMDVLRPLFADRLRGRPITDEVWEKALSAELGPQAVAEWRAINVDGTAALHVDSDVYGPCVESYEETLKDDGGNDVVATLWRAKPGAALAACRAAWRP